jgi:hypothetical protein
MRRRRRAGARRLRVSGDLGRGSCRTMLTMIAESVEDREGLLGALCEEGFQPGGCSYRHRNGPSALSFECTRQPSEQRLTRVGPGRRLRLTGVLLWCNPARYYPAAARRPGKIRHPDWHRRVVVTRISIDCARLLRSHRACTNERWRWEPHTDSRLRRSAGRLRDRTARRDNQNTLERRSASERLRPPGQDVSGDSFQDHTQCLRLRDAGELYCHRRTSQVGPIQNARAAHAGPFLQDSGKRHILRGQRDPTFAELKRHVLLCAGSRSDTRNREAECQRSQRAAKSHVLYQATAPTL